MWNRSPGKSMATFENKTRATAQPAQTIEADDYQMDTHAGKLTFTDKDNKQLASFAIGPGAYVKRIK